MRRHNRLWMSSSDKLWGCATTRSTDETWEGVLDGFEDVADAVLYCITRPRHVNVNAIEIMPTEQAFAGFAVHRRKKKG